MSDRTPFVEARVTESPLSAGEAAARVADSAAGARLVFEGIVRDHHAGKAVSYLEYEAYVPMAERALGDILAGAVDRWPLTGILVHHRIGRLEVGEVSLVVVVGSAHRAEAFAACAGVIDEIKRLVPIWKREVGPDGSFWIEGPEHVRSAL